jgi:hypothetical protein
MEHRVTITLSEHGFDEQNIERVLEGFLATAPEIGPVVDANTEEGTLSVTFSIDVPEDEFTREAGEIFAAGMNSSALPRTRVVNTEVEAVGAAAELERDLQPA